MQFKIQHETQNGELFSPISNPKQAAAAETLAECDAQEHPARRGGGLDAVAQPGEEAPRLVTRGESFNLGSDTNEAISFKPINKNGRVKLVYVPLPKPDGEPLAALTDYLNTTFQFNPTQDNIVLLVRQFSEFLGVPFGSLKERRGGLHGYKKSFDIGETCAQFAYGGQRGTALVSFPGSACALIKDWHACYHLFNTLLGGRITRWDGAVDMFDGEPSVDDGVEWYKAGLFNTGGNKPSCRQNGNWIEPDGRGRTFNIGLRENGKTLRIYEKGKHLGDVSSPWVRWELELHNRDRRIPWEVILEPGKYVAGSYPCMGWVSLIQERIRTTQKTASVSYQHLSFYLSRAYGRMLNVMLDVEGSPEKVIKLLQQPGVPKRLKLGEGSLAELIKIPGNSGTE
jgi:phage replication initiation protein